MRVTSWEKIIVLISSFSWLNRELTLTYKSYAGGYYYCCYYDHYFFYLLLAMSPWVWHSPHLADNTDTVSRGPGLIKELVF